MEAELAGDLSKEQEEALLASLNDKETQLEQLQEAHQERAAKAAALQACVEC